MKKAIAALLASFVGLFGYQIVDKTLEARVDNLEYQVSSQQEEIESLHGIGKYYVDVTDITNSTEDESSKVSESQTDSTRLETQPYYEAAEANVGDTYKYDGVKKLALRVLEDGRFVRVNRGCTPLDDDYYLYVDEAKAEVLSLAPCYTTKYDRNYDTVQVRTGYDGKIMITFKGHTDATLAGKRIVIMGSEDNRWLSITTNHENCSIEKANNYDYYIYDKAIITIADDGSIEGVFYADFSNREPARTVDWTISGYDGFYQVY